MPDISKPLREYMRVVRMLNILRQRAVILEARIAKAHGPKKGVYVDRLEATRAEIEALLNEGDHHLADLRGYWRGQRRRDY